MFVSSYRNTVLNQRAHLFALGYFLNMYGGWIDHSWPYYCSTSYRGYIYINKYNGLFYDEQILFILHKQPSQNVSEEEAILKLEAVWLLKATFRAPIGCEHVGGSRGIPPPLGNSWNLDAQWCDLVQSGGPEGWELYLIFTNLIYYHLQ